MTKCYAFSLTASLESVCFDVYWPSEFGAFIRSSTMAKQRDGNKSIMIMLDININKPQNEANVVGTK